MIHRRLIIIIYFILLLAGAANAAVPTVIYPWGEGTWFDPIMTTDNHNGSWVAVNEPFTHSVRMFHVDSAGAVQCSLAYHGTAEISPQHIETDSAGGFFLLHRETIYVFVEPELYPLDRIKLRHYSASGEFTWEALVADTFRYGNIYQTSLTMLDTTLLVCWQWERSDSSGLYCQRINTQSGNLIGSRMRLWSTLSTFDVSVSGSWYFIVSSLWRLRVSLAGDTSITTGQPLGSCHIEHLGDTVFVAGSGAGSRIFVERYVGITRLALDTLSQVDVPYAGINLVRQPQGIRISWQFNEQLFTRKWAHSSGWDSTQQLCQDTMAYDHQMVATDSGATLIWYYWVHRDHIFAQRINDRHIYWQPDGLALWPMSGRGFYLCSGSPYGIAAWFDQAAGLCVAPVDCLSINPITGSSILKPSCLDFTVYPNPFNPTVEIRYDLERTSLVSITIYNTLGQAVATLLHETTITTGSHSIQWSPESEVSSGIYFVQIKADQKTEVKKAILLR